MLKLVTSHISSTCTQRPHDMVSQHAETIKDQCGLGARAIYCINTSKYQDRVHCTPHGFS